MEFGAFVELEPGIEGLIHVSELSPNRVRRVADIVKPDQEVEVRDPQSRARGTEDRAVAPAVAQGAPPAEDEARRIRTTRTRHRLRRAPSPRFP